MKLVRKDDNTIAIVSTLERVLGACALEGATRNADGKLEIQYGFGGTEINWDTAETVPDSEGGLTFIDENGDEVPESNVELVPE